MDVGFIVPENLYVLQELAEKFRIGKKALRDARKKGLNVHYWANGSYVLGRDFIDHILTHGRRER